jgi:hypothetical protein
MTGSLLQCLTQGPGREQIARQGLGLPPGKHASFLGAVSEVAMAATAAARSAQALRTASIIAADPTPDAAHRHSQ